MYSKLHYSTRVLFWRILTNSVPLKTFYPSISLATTERNFSRNIQTQKTTQNCGALNIHQLVTDEIFPAVQSL